jgi:hypothetical protein
LVIRVRQFESFEKVRFMSRQRSLNAGLLAFGVIVVLAGCGTAPTKARREDFQSTDTFSREYSTTPAQTCEAGKRALMSQGYLIDKADSGTVTGHKNFEQMEDNSHTQIQFQVVCSPSDSAALGSTAFVNAVQDRYTIKRSSTAASVGVTILGSVSMPFGSSPDSLVKVASETISRPEFYDGFFTLLKRNLPRASGDEGKANHAAASKKAKEEKAPLPPVVAPKSTPEPALTPAAAGLSTAPSKPTDSGSSSGSSPSSGSSSGSSPAASGSQAPAPAATSPSGVTAPAAPPKATALGSSTGASAPAAAGGPATPSAGNTGSSVGGSSSGTTGASTKTPTGSSATATPSSAADTQASTGSSTTPNAAGATDPGPSSGSSSAAPTPSPGAP